MFISESVVTASYRTASISVASTNPRARAERSLTIVDRLLVDYAALCEVVQVVQLHLLPGYVGDPQVHVPELLVLLLHAFVQSPGNLVHKHTQVVDENSVCMDSHSIKVNFIVNAKYAEDIQRNGNGVYLRNKNKWIKLGKIR